MKTEIWDCNNIAPKKPKFAPTREEIAEYTRQFLADGGTINKLEAEPVPDNRALYISAKAEVKWDCIQER